MRQSPWVRHLPYLVASAVAFALCTRIELPFSNPWNIVGGLAQAHFNPANNILRFLLFVGAPVLLLALLRLLPFTRKLSPWGETAAGTYGFSHPQTAAKSLSPLVLLSGLFCVILALNTSTYHESSPLLDTFHEGESLGTSVSLLHGGTPYKDILFAHGVFEDPLRSVVAFKVFTRSIGAARTLDSILSLLCFLAMFVFLQILFEGRTFWTNLTLMALLLALYCRWLIILPRDITTFAFLIVTALLVRAVKEPEPRLSGMRCVALALFSFLPIAAMMYSIDRGFYLTATCLVLLPLIVFHFRLQSLYRALIFAALGIGIAVVFAGVLLHRGFRAFISFALVTLPRYKELVDGFVYPFQSPKYLLIVLIISWNVYWFFAGFLTALLRGARRPGAMAAFLRMHLMDICLVLLSLCFFRSALGRSDWEHIAYSCGIPYILFCYLLVKYWLGEALEKCPRAEKLLGRAVACIMAIACLAGGYRIGSQHLLTRDFPLNKPDAEFIPSDYQQGLSFLRENLSREDEFFTMTSEGAWYYILNQPCPSRFPVVWLAEPPFYQREVIQDLQAHRVKIILYTDNSDYGDLDDIKARERLPLVDAYIRDNYRPYATIAGMEFWIRKL